jgi:hypothetical protein
MWEPLGAVLLVFALLGLSLWWLKRRGLAQLRTTTTGAAAPYSAPFRFWPERKPKGPKILQRVDALALTPTHSLHLVRMAERAILLGTSPSGFYLVESSPWKNLEGQTVSAVPQEGGQA